MYDQTYVYNFYNLDKIIKAALNDKLTLQT